MSPNSSKQSKIGSCRIVPSWPHLFECSHTREFGLVPSLTSTRHWWFADQPWVFYDVSYDRALFDPTNTTCAGKPGNNIVFDETIDVYNAEGVSQDVIDPTKLPRGLDRHGICVPVYPHNAIPSNTIFEVVKAAGGHTAWADKHPAYDLVNGPSGEG